MLSLLALTCDARDPAGLARFWAGVLDRDVVDDGRGHLLPGDEAHPSLRFVESRIDRLGPNRVHLHLTSATAADQRQTVSTVLGLGGSALDVGQRPDEGHVVLADPEGNEFCVIEAGSAFLAGCGFLGEIACDGTREVGVFWGAALDWPLVWDQDQETAIQSPRGGTKIAWGGPPVAPRLTRDRHRLDLLAGDGDVTAEVDRLVSLGATLLAVGEDGSADLTDPDGNEFCLRAR